MVISCKNNFRHAYKQGLGHVTEHNDEVILGRAGYSDYH